MPKTITPRQKFEAELAELAQNFERQRSYYLGLDYPEAQARQDFITPFFEALGWNISKQAGLAPKERDVLEEKGETRGRPDYTFQLDGRPVFFVEAKAPHVPLDRTDVVMQAKLYAWNSRDVFIAVVTDFEEIRLYDATVKPDRKHPEVGLVFAHKYTDYLKPKTLDGLWLLSKEAVRGGSIERLLQMSSVKARQRMPVDRAFLDDLTAWREKLAKAVYKTHSDLAAPDLNSVVQVFLDRLVFIRIAEDRGILSEHRLKDIASAWEYSGKRRSMAVDLNALFHEVNLFLNGEIFKPHLCEKMDWDACAELVADIIHGMYQPVSPYRFDVIGVELLGSIYERYLGKTIRVTATRAVVEDKPEVRKAGGVYYTPRYIVDYIVEQTVGRAIQGKTPKQIAKLKILDPACGSGSFLLGAYQKLLDYVEHYHEQYYAGQARKRGKQAAQPQLLAEAEGGQFRLPLEQRAAILRNNIFGVDIDPQAVEITMMSLYIKMLEGERGAMAGRGVLPPLRNNVKCGNSLIGYDIVGAIHGGAIGESPRLDRINPFDWRSRSEGFGEIMAAGGFDCVIGNPPYVRQEMFSDLKGYLQHHYGVYSGTADLYVYFVELGMSLLKPGGKFGIIVANKWMRANYGEPLRRWMKKQRIEEITDFGDLPVFQQATTYPCVLRLARSSPCPSFEATQVASLDFSDLADYVREHCYTVNQSALDDAGWSLADECKQALLAKLRTTGVPLGEYVKGQIYYGIKTGLNKAFIIDAETRDRLIAKDPKSAELIKPFLMGRDVQRYHTPARERYLIFTRRGVNIKQYPAIEQYLVEFKEQLMPKPKGWKGKEWKGRKPGPYAWYEIQDTVDYYAEFEKPKIIAPAIVRNATYSFDSKRFYSNDKTSIIVTDDLYLLGVLNSKVPDFVMHAISSTKQGGYFEYKPMYLVQIPIRPINFSDPADAARHDKLVTLVERMLALHKQKQAAPSEAARARLEREIHVTDEAIDTLVYELYNLTTKEIAIVEGAGSYR